MQLFNLKAVIVIDWPLAGFKAHFAEKLSTYGRHFFDSIDRTFIELISKLYRSYIEEMRAKDALFLPLFILERRPLPCKY